MNSIEDWRPSVIKRRTVPISAWRQAQIAGNYNQKVGARDLKKIQGFIKRGAPEFEILESFGISAETLIAIKKNRYEAGTGIVDDRVEFVLEDIKPLLKKAHKYRKALDSIAVNLFPNHKDFAEATLYFIQQMQRDKLKKSKKSTQEDEILT